MLTSRQAELDSIEVGLSLGLFSLGRLQSRLCSSQLILGPIERTTRTISCILSGTLGPVSSIQGSLGVISSLLSSRGRSGSLVVGGLGLGLISQCIRVIGVSLAQNIISLGQSRSSFVISMLGLSLGVSCNLSCALSCSVGGGLSISGLLIISQGCVSSRSSIGSRMSGGLRISGRRLGSRQSIISGLGTGLSLGNGLVMIRGRSYGGVVSVRLSAGISLSVLNRLLRSRDIALSVASDLVSFLSGRLLSRGIAVSLVSINLSTLGRILRISYRLVTSLNSSLSIS